MIDYLASLPHLPSSLAIAGMIACYFGVIAYVFITHKQENQ